MTTEHPITPPPKLVWQWHDEWMDSDESGVFMEKLAIQAARWGADQELEACMEWMRSHFHGVPQWADELRAARRPKPPSLAEEALKALQDQIDTSFKLSSKAQERVDLICAALERLQELEEGNE